MTRPTPSEIVERLGLKPPETFETGVALSPDCLFEKGYWNGGLYWRFRDFYGSDDAAFALVDWAIANGMLDFVLFAPSSEAENDEWEAQCNNDDGDYFSGCDTSRRAAIVAAVLAWAEERK